MRVQLISNLFAPDELAGAALFSDLALFLRERGHDVRVTATFSYYPAWKVRPEDKGVAFRDEQWQDIPVRRVSMYVPASPTGKTRLLADLSFLLSLLRRGRHAGWVPEVVVTALPMLSQCLVQRFLYLGRRIPRLIVVQDFVVGAALELGILRAPGAARFLGATERWALRSSATLTTISPRMLEKLRATVGDDCRTVLIPNWIHESLQKEIHRQFPNRPQRSKSRLFYSGNLGIKQGLPDFLTHYRSSGVSDMGWSLVIHGGGADKQRLAGEVDHTAGCTLGPVLDEPAYVSELLSATACLVTERVGVSANFLPSKLLPALATGTPVLAVCDRSSPLADEVRDGGFGEIVTPGHVAALRATLDRWAREPGVVEALSQRALQRARRYSRDVILPQYEAELQRLVDVAQRSRTPDR